jgi:AcrR family transcriptional regulator
VAAIVEAAEQLLVDVGYAEASTNAIARRAGVSIGSLYQYFPDKEAVFRAVMERHRATMHPVKERALKALQEDDHSLDDVLARILDDALTVRAANPPLMRALEEELSAVAARWGGTGPGGEEVAGGKVARAIARRTGTTLDEARRRAWLASLVLETVGRRLVHSDLPDQEIDILKQLTVKMVVAMLEHGAGAEMS